MSTDENNRIEKRSISYSTSKSALLGVFCFARKETKGRTISCPKMVASILYSGLE